MKGNVYAISTSALCRVPRCFLFACRGSQVVHRPLLPVPPPTGIDTVAALREDRDLAAARREINRLVKDSFTAANEFLRSFLCPPRPHPLPPCISVTPSRPVPLQRPNIGRVGRERGSLYPRVLRHGRLAALGKVFEHGRLWNFDEYQARVHSCAQIRRDLRALHQWRQEINGSARRGAGRGSMFCVLRPRGVGCEMRDHR